MVYMPSRSCLLHAVSNGQLYVTRAIYFASPNLIRPLPKSRTQALAR